MKVRVGTFNLENLFNRYALLDEPWENRSYEKIVAAYDVATIASRAGDLVSYETTQIQRNNTALSIEAARPDILAVQEVENLVALRNFNHIYLDDYFDRQILIDGNDPRGIDVGLLLRAGFPGEIQDVRTHVDETAKGKSVIREARHGFGYLAQNALFSRDCLEVDVKVGGSTLTLLVNHLKAQDSGKTHVARRRSQSERVAKLVDENLARGHKPIVLGDLNVDTKKKDKSLDPLIKHKKLKDTDPTGTWTHYYSGGKSVSRLDYILVDKTLAHAKVEIVRNGLTTKCKQYTGPRFPTIGPEHTEASDHSAVVVELTV
jgi:endonuclease/exonuclease/phosphatase family metal-dependent hydrolase